MLRNTLYYNLKPFIPRTLRTALRRQLAQRLRKEVAEVWPIMPGSEFAPAGWPGWPGGSKFALVLTHDVENKAGLGKCGSLMQLEKEMGFRSSFNFVPEGNYRLPSTLRQELLRSGFEIGVHDLKHDGRLFRSEAEFQKSALKINRYLEDWKAVGFRSAFMLHKLDWLHQLDIEYDMSTFDTDPFEPEPEGRYTIFPSWIQRLPRLPGSANGAVELTSASRSNGSAKGYVELPYTLPQDFTLFVLLREPSIDLWIRKVDWIVRHNGMVLLDTHPDYMNFSSAKPRSDQYPVKRYIELLEYIRSRYEGQYWHALPREVAAHTSRTRHRDRENLSGLPFPSLVTEQSPPSSQNGRHEAVVFPTEKEESAAIGSTLVPGGKRTRLHGKHAAVLLFSYFPADSRPRRAAEALVAEGVTVDLICLQDEGAPKRERINGVDISRIPIKRCRGSKIKYITQYLAFIVRSFLKLAFRSISRRYDFVHVHNMPDVLVFSALVPKAFGAKVILDLHDPMPELMQTIFNLSEASFGVRLLKYLEKLSIGFADLVITVNLACQRIYSSRGCRPDKIAVIMNAPEDQVFRFQRPSPAGAKGGGPARPFSIMYHGSLVPRNGFDLAVDALEIARQRIPHLKLMVCGETNEYFTEVMKSVEKRGLAESVQYLGLKNQREIAELINRCDLGVVPNHRNRFTDINTPTRIFEYLSLGKPVVAPRTHGIEDYFGSDDLLFFQAGDNHDLARQIEFAYFNREKLVPIVERGQRVYLTNSWSRQKSVLLDSIAGLL